MQEVADLLVECGKWGLNNFILSHFLSLNYSDIEIARGAKVKAC